MIKDHERIKKLIKSAVKSEADNRQKAIDDLEFCNLKQSPRTDLFRGKSDNKPDYVIDLTDKYIQQIVGDIRLKMPSIDIIPADVDGNRDMADIRAGIIRRIQYQSKFKTTLGFAAESLTRCGYAGWHIETEFESDMSFNKTARIVPNRNAFAYYLDPDRKELDGSDAEWGIILSKMDEKEFVKEFPKAKYKTASNIDSDGNEDDLWYHDNKITIAAYYHREKVRQKVVLLSDGRSMLKEDAEQEISKQAKDAKEISGRLGLDNSGVDLLKIVKERESFKYKIKHKIISGMEILTEEEDIPGKYIPIVLGYGEIIDIAGKQYIRGKIRAAKDSQILFNHWENMKAISVSMTPLARWLATQKMVEGYEKDYARGNVEGFPVMFYNIDQQAPAGDKPSFINPPPFPQAFAVESANQMRNVESVMGMYSASVGAPGNEVSGVAISNRDEQSDTGNFVYYDSISIMVEHTGRILNSMLPELMDASRYITVTNYDETESKKPINMPVKDVINGMNADATMYEGADKNKLLNEMAKSGPDYIHNDMSRGEFNVVVSVGPTYTTQRKKASREMMDFARMSSGMNPIDKYFLLKTADWPGSSEYLEAVKRTLPQGLIEPKPGDRPMPPMPTPPQVQLAFEKEKTEQIKQQALIAKLQNETAKAQKTESTSDSHIREIVLEVLQKVHQ